MTFPAEEKRIAESVVRGGAAAEEDWVECDPAEERNDEDYEYKSKDDPDTMSIQTFKRKRHEGMNAIDYGMPTQVQMTIKDPFTYHEEVLYPELNDMRHSDVQNKSVYDSMLSLSHVLPFGYPTEQFIR